MGRVWRTGIRRPPLQVLPLPAFSSAPSPLLTVCKYISTTRGITRRAEGDSPVVLHSDHCAKELLPWFDGMLEADEKYFKEHGEPLYSCVLLPGSNADQADRIPARICSIFQRSRRRTTLPTAKNTLRGWRRWAVSTRQRRQGNQADALRLPCLCCDHPLCPARVSVL